MFNLENTYGKADAHGGIKAKTDDVLGFRPVTGETSRKYIFPNGEVTIRNVKKLVVRPSGNHRLGTADGKKHIVRAGWLAIEIEAREWSF
jgi:hypothetical protein